MYTATQRKLFDCDCTKKGKLEESNMELRKYNKDLNSNRNGNTEKSDHNREELLAIRTRFPTKIPVIVQKYKWDKNLPLLDKTKYLVPEDITISQFQMIIRNRMQLQANKALYLLINERSMVSLSMTMAEVYKEFGDQNGYLYVTYASQETFG